MIRYALVALAAALFPTGLCAEEISMATMTTEVSTFIKSHPRTEKRADGSFFLPHIRGEEAGFIMFIPAAKEVPNTLVFQTTVVMLSPAGEKFACKVGMIDQGLVGKIGPKDGYTQCTGANMSTIGVAERVSKHREQIYQNMLQKIFEDALSYKHKEKNKKRAPPREEVEPPILYRT